MLTPLREEGVYVNARISKGPPETIGQISFVHEVAVEERQEDQSPNSCVYKQLRKASCSCRTKDLFASAFGDPVDVRLNVAKLTPGTIQPYEALSCAWSSGNNRQKVSV